MYLDGKEFSWLKIPPERGAYIGLRLVLSFAKRVGVIDISGFVEAPITTLRWQSSNPFSMSGIVVTSRNSNCLKKGFSATWVC